MAPTDFYAPDLAYIHHTGFGAFAEGAAPGVLELLRRAGLVAGLVVDLGCGSGLWARSLLAAGYDVLGVDGSAAMTELARTVASGARFVTASQYAVEIPPCVAVTALGESFSYLGDDDPRQALPALFARIHDALHPGGLLIFDTILRSRHRPLRGRTVRTGPDWRVEAETEEHPQESLLERRITTWRRQDGAERKSRETHRVRTFARAELEELLRARGFTVRVSRRYGDMELGPQRLAFRARKARPRSAGDRRRAGGEG